MNRRPLIGVTSEIEPIEGLPSPAYYRRSQIHDDNFLAISAAPVLLPHHVECVQEYIAKLDGIFILGGPYQFPDEHLFDEDDPSVPPYKARRYIFEKALVREAIRIGKPLLCVCGGFQILNIVLGGRITVKLRDVNPDWALHSQAQPHVLPHDVNLREGTLLAAICGESRVAVNSLHQQGVLVAQAAGVISATTDDGVVEAIEAPDVPFALGLQWHPEYLHTDLDRKIMRAFIEAASRYR